MTILQNLNFDIIKYNENLFNKFNIYKLDSKKEEIQALYTVYFDFLKINKFSFSAKMLKKHKEIYSKIIQDDNGEEIYTNFLSDLLYPCQNMKLFYLMLDKIGLPSKDESKENLYRDSFYINNLKACEIIQKNINIKIDYNKILKVIKNSDIITDIAPGIDNSSKTLVKSTKNSYDYLIKKITQEDLIKLNKEFCFNAESNSDFICEFIIKNVSSFDFIYYLTDDLINKYKEEISEKIQKLMLHSDNRCLSFIPFIIEKKLIDKDSFNYEYLYKKNNKLLLLFIDPDFFKKSKNIYFYIPLIKNIVNKIRQYKDCYKFIEGFLEVEDNNILQTNISCLKKFFFENYIINPESFEENLLMSSADKFFYDYFYDVSLKEKSENYSREKLYIFIENKFIIDNINENSLLDIKKKRI